LNVSIFVGMCQLHPDFKKNVLIRSFKKKY